MEKCQHIGERDILLVSGSTSLYFFLLRVLYAVLGVKVPEVVFFAGLVLLVALAWYGLKSWQWSLLQAAQAVVPRRYSRRQITYRGWLAFALGVASIWGVCLVGIGTVADYKNWL